MTRGWLCNVKPMLIEIASKDGCVWCERAIKLVHDWSALEQTEVNLSISKAPTVFYAEYVQSIKDSIAPAQQSAFPFVWVDGQFVGGYQGLKKELLKRERRS